MLMKLTKGKSANCNEYTIKVGRIQLSNPRAVPRTGPAGPRPEAQNLEGRHISKIVKQ